MGEKEEKNLTDPYSFARVVSALAVFLLHFDVFCNMFGFGPDKTNHFFRIAGHGAVWVFFFLSGFFNIRGFLGNDPLYPLTRKGVFAFYKKRFLRMVLPAWCFIFISLSVSEPAFVALHPETLINFITCTYTGDPGCSSIAAVWYVSSLAWLYLLTPFAAYIIRALYNKDGRWQVILSLILLTGLGLAERLVLLWLRADWTQEVFVPFYCNIDIYLCGALSYILCTRTGNKKGNKLCYILSIIPVPLILLIHSRINYLSDAAKMYKIIYGYIMPSVYIVVMTIFTLMAENTGYRYEKAGISTIRRNPFRVIDLLSSISFEIYLVHSMVLFQLSFLIHEDTAKTFRLRLLLLGVPVTLVFAYLLHRMTYIDNKNRAEN